MAVLIDAVTWARFYAVEPDDVPNDPSEFEYIAADEIRADFTRGTLIFLPRR